MNPGDTHWHLTEQGRWKRYHKLCFKVELLYWRLWVLNHRFADMPEHHWLILLQLVDVLDSMVWFIDCELALSLIHI